MNDISKDFPTKGRGQSFRKIKTLQKSSWRVTYDISHLISIEKLLTFSFVIDFSYDYLPNMLVFPLG